MRRKIFLAGAALLAATSLGCRGVPPPSKGVGLAFNLPPADGSELPGPPAFFVRSAGAVTWAPEPIVVPAALERVDYEGELVAVIGRRARRVTVEEARECILGYTCGMDGTPQVFGPDGEKDLLRSLAGKSADGIAPVGPRIVESLDPEGHAITLRVNGMEVERANTADLVWDPARAVAEISRTVTLEPGDVVYCGARRALPELRDGDVVEVEIEGIGVLRRRVEAERSRG